MRERVDKIEGPFTVSEDLTLRGMIAGDATVATGTTLILYGMVAGDLTIEPHARVQLHGMVTGSVVNRGVLEVWGTISGTLTDVDGGSSTVDAGAVVGES